MNFQASGSNPLSHVVPHPLKQVEMDLGALLTPKGVVTVLSDQIMITI